jgi:hypothetical protein
MSTPKQRAANRLNAKKSTGPKTAAGRAKSKMNATQHGLTGRYTGLCQMIADEGFADFLTYYERLVEASGAVGALEEEQVKRMAEAGWKLRRADRIEACRYETEKNAVALDLARRKWKEARQLEEDLLTPEGKALSEEDTAEFRKTIQFYKDLAQKNLENCEEWVVPDIGSVFQRLTANSSESSNSRESRKSAEVSSEWTKSSDCLSALLRYKTSLERSYDRALNNLLRLQAIRMGRMAPP